MCGVVRERLLPCRVLATAKWVVSCTRITCIQPLSRCSLTLLAYSFFSKSVVVVFVFLCVCVFHLMLAGRQPFGILRWFQLFLFFSFGVSCLLA